MRNLAFLVITFATTCSLAQHIVDNSCPERPILQDFKLSEYLGRWYEISRYEQRFEVGCDCGFADYTLRYDGKVRVRNCCKRLPNTTLSCTIGQAIISYPNEVPLEGKLSVSFHGKEPSESNYWILDTDYNNYVIVYFCKPKDDTPNKSIEAFWLLSKEKILNAEAKQKADQYIDKYFDRAAIRVTQHDDAICGPDE